MDLLEIEKIKKLAIIAMASDDYLMDQLVLKGGNAIDLVYQLSGRGSFDIDYSISSEFDQAQMESIVATIKKSLIETFGNEGWVVFDVKFSEKPVGIGETDEMKFWGGYQIKFKLIPVALHQYSEDIQILRMNAMVVGPQDKRIFEISISKFEYCAPRIAKELEGYNLFVYSPEMIVLEKLRSICQQIPEYRDSVKSHEPVQRARDFFDIYVVSQKYPINLNTPETKRTLEAIFQAKNVSLSYLKRIHEFRDFHRAGFDSLRDTVRSGVQLKDFDFYFDYVVDLIS